MQINGRTIRVSITMQEYNDRACMRSFLLRQRIFRTPKARSIYAERAGVYGVHVASACYERCPQCKFFDQELASHPVTNGNTCYGVYSYNTRIYAYCQHCGYIEHDLHWYSKTTRVLQEHLADVYAVFALELATQQEIEENALKYWETHGKPKNDDGRAMNVREMIELYTGFKQPGGFVKLGGARREPRVIEMSGMKITIEQV